MPAQQKARLLCNSTTNIVERKTNNMATSRLKSVTTVLLELRPLISLPLSPKKVSYTCSSTKQLPPKLPDKLDRYHGPAIGKNKTKSVVGFFPLVGYNRHFEMTNHVPRYKIVIITTDHYNRYAS